MPIEQAHWFRQLMMDIQAKNALELGFHHGTGTCYMAGIMDELDGHVTSIDLKSTADITPTVEQQLDSIGLSHRATIYREPSCYTTRLGYFLTETSRPIFDFIYLDGAHTWSPDGFAFFLADKLLIGGGYMVLDDLNFSWSTFTGLTTKDSIIKKVRQIPIDGWNGFQVMDIWNLLVKEHPNYTGFQEITYPGLRGTKNMMGVCRKVKE